MIEKLLVAPHESDKDSTEIEVKSDQLFISHENCDHPQSISAWIPEAHILWIFCGLIDWLLSERNHHEIILYQRILIITHFNSWESNIAKLALCKECDKLHITLSWKKKNWKIFKNAYFDLKSKKKCENFFLCQRAIFCISLLARYQIWQKSPKTKKNAPNWL